MAIYYGDGRNSNQQRTLGMTTVYSSSTTVSASNQSGTQLGSLDFYFPTILRAGGSFTKHASSSDSYIVAYGWYHSYSNANLHDTWIWIDGAEDSALHLGVDPYAQSGEDGGSARLNYGWAFNVKMPNSLNAGSHTLYPATGAGDTRSYGNSELNPNNAGRNGDTSNHATHTQIHVLEIRHG